METEDNGRGSPNVFTGIWWLSPPKSRWTKPTFAEKQSERVANTKLWVNREVLLGVKVMPANIGGIFWPSGKAEGGQQSNEESKLDVVCVVEGRRLFLLLLLLQSLRKPHDFVKSSPFHLIFLGGDGSLPIIFERTTPLLLLLQTRLGALLA